MVSEMRTVVRRGHLRVINGRVVTVRSHRLHTKYKFIYAKNQRDAIYQYWTKYKKIPSRIQRYYERDKNQPKGLLKYEVEF